MHTIATPFGLLKKGEKRDQICRVNKRLLIGWYYNLERSFRRRRNYFLFCTCSVALRPGSHWRATGDKRLGIS
jgi:hypothetical protein